MFCLHHPSYFLTRQAGYIVLVKRPMSPSAGQIRIRPCRVADVAAVLELWKRADAVPSVTDSPAALRCRLQRDPQLFLLAWHGRRIVGSIIGGWDGWRASVARLAVDPEYRRLGLGRILVHKVEKKLRELGAKRISGIVLEDNSGGRAFWQRAGYRLDPGVTRYVKDLR